MYETPRLILRDWKACDVEPFIALNQDSTVMEFFPQLYSAEESIQSIERFKKSIKQYGYGMFACELKESGAFMGFVGLMRRDSEFLFSPCVEIGWRLASKYWGRGFATEAAQKCIEIGFNKFNLDEIVSFAAKINTKSERVMQKIGIIHAMSQDC